MAQRDHADRREDQAGGESLPASAPGTTPLEALQHAVGNRALARMAAEDPSLTLLRAAAADPARPLDLNVRRPVEQMLGRSLGGVRVHSGDASEAAAAALGARAYTVGTDVFLGRRARSASPEDQRRLLAHEAVHTVQQGSVAVALRDSLRVGAPDSAAEHEAAAVADAVASPGVAMRDSLRVSRVAPAIQRDLDLDHDITEGKFKLKLKTESHAGAKSGMKGTIKFFPKATAPDSTLIKLYQTVRNEDLTTGRDYVWTGANAAITGVQTTADTARGIEGGYGIDHLATDPKAKIRTKLADPAVPIYYRDYAPNSSESQDGSKQGATIHEASLWDYPGWTRKMRWSFETVAKAVDTGHVYGAVTWGFTLSDPATGSITGERSAGHDTQSATAAAALRRFHEYYRNPGATTAPTT